MTRPVVEVHATPAAFTPAEGFQTIEIEVESTVTAVEINPLIVEVVDEGDQGPAGAAGATGADGADGRSAYEVAVDNGFVGTEPQWLASLVGADGADGAQGPQGPQGIQGVPGADGADAELPIRRYDESGNYQYAGTNTNGAAAEGDATWTIRRLTYAAGAYVTTQQAVNVTWTGRYGHTYN